MMVEESSKPKDKKLCECNCGKIIDAFDRWGRKRRFEIGHWLIGKKLVNEERVCSICKKTVTYTEKSKRKDGSVNEVSHWRSDKKGGWLCDKCYCKYVKEPKWAPIRDPVRSPMRIVYKGKRRRLKTAPRIGVCNWCRAVSGQIDAQVGKLCKTTHMNHMLYDDDDPLKHTIENCARCHKKYHLKIIM